MRENDEDLPLSQIVRKHTLGKQVEKYRKRMVQLHLLVVQRQTIQNGRVVNLVGEDVVNCKQHEAQADAVVLKMTVVNQQYSRIQ
jgi:hypothetical protein